MVVVVVALVVVAAAIAAGTADTKVSAVLLRSTLSDGHQDRLVIGGTGHGADAITTRGQTSSHLGGKPTLAITGIVDALEESKLPGIKGLGGVQGVAGVLDSDVCVANDLTIPVEVLGSRVIGACSVREGAELHVGNVDLDLEGLEGREIVAVLGVKNDCRNHPIEGRDLAHRCLQLAGNRCDEVSGIHTDTIARAIPVLQTVGQGLARAEIDEVGIITGKLVSALW